MRCGQEVSKLSCTWARARVHCFWTDESDTQRSRIVERLVGFVQLDRRDGRNGRNGDGRNGRNGRNRRNRLDRWDRDFGRFRRLRNGECRNAVTTLEFELLELPLSGRKLVPLNVLHGERRARYEHNAEAQRE